MSVIFHANGCDCCPLCPSLRQIDSQFTSPFYHPIPEQAVFPRLMVVCHKVSKKDLREERLMSDDKFFFSLMDEMFSGSYGVVSAIGSPVDESETNKDLRAAMVKCSPNLENVLVRERPTHVLLLGADVSRWLGDFHSSLSMSEIKGRGWIFLRDSMLTLPAFFFYSPKIVEKKQMTSIDYLKQLQDELKCSRPRALPSGRESSTELSSSRKRSPVN